jgi:hypothetical protein
MATGYIESTILPGPEHKPAKESGEISILTARGKLIYLPAQHPTSNVHILIWHHTLPGDEENKLQVLGRHILPNSR